MDEVINNYEMIFIINNFYCVCICKIVDIIFEEFIERRRNGLIVNKIGFFLNIRKFILVKDYWMIL